MQHDELLNGIGKVVRYVDNEPLNPLRAGEKIGLVVDAQKTSGGSVRVRLRMKTQAPRGGERLECLLYANQGRFDLAESQDITPYVNH